MSHFTVMVVGDDYEKQLAPFHEFECTGNNDQYIQELDITEEAKENYYKGTINRIKLADGTLMSPWDDTFYQPPTEEELVLIEKQKEEGTRHQLHTATQDWGDGLGYSLRVRHYPEGSENVELKERDFRSLEEFTEDYYGSPTVPFGQRPDLEGTHKFGYIQLDANGDVFKVINRTNPNSKWDWYQVGGRWAGMLKLKQNIVDTIQKVAKLKKEDKSVPTSLEKLIDGINIGSKSWVNAGEEIEVGYVDSARISQIDFEGVRKSNIDRATKVWDEYQQRCIKRLGDKYHESTYNREVANHGKGEDFMYGVKESDTKESFVKRREMFSTFAVLKDGEWYEKGSMGWWAIVSDEDTDWESKFNELLASLDEDTLITIVDCHI